MNKRFYWCVLLALLMNLSAAIVPASVDHRTIQFGQNITLTINNAHTNPDISPLSKDFDIYGTSTSSQLSVINGHVDSQTSFVVTLSPKHEGVILIPAITVGNDKTSPIQINVSKSIGFNRSSNQLSSKDDSTYDKVFMDVSVESDSVYAGMPVVYSMRLYYLTRITNVGLLPVNIKNGQMNPLGQAKQYESSVGGVSYHVVEQKFLITSTSESGINVPSLTIKGNMIDTGNGFLTNFFKPFMINSKPLTVLVKKAPSGIDLSRWLVAKNVSLTDTWSVESSAFLKIGDPITRVITIKAVGVLPNFIPDIGLSTPSNINAYPDKPVLDSKVDGDQLVSTKMIKIVYIPTSGGDVNFKDICLNWLDVLNNESKVATIGAKHFIVSGVAKSIGKSLVEYPKTTLPKKNTVKFNRILWLSMILVALLVLIVLFLYCWYLYKNVRVSKNKSLQKSYKDVVRACQTKDIRLLNKGLIVFASLYWQDIVYTISDIKKLTTNNNLIRLIDQLNVALYKNDTFSKFEELQLTITHIISDKLSVPQKVKNTLNTIYPV